jgi:hypothetical protein
MSLVLAVLWDSYHLGIPFAFWLRYTLICVPARRGEQTAVAARQERVQISPNAAWGGPARGTERALVAR